MEITMDKIDELRKREKVSYKRAKELLEENNGDVLMALCALEDARKEVRRQRIEKVKDAFLDAKDKVAGKAVELHSNMKDRASEYGTTVKGRAGELREEFTVKAGDVIEKVKEIVKDGHVSKVNVKSGGKTLVEIPMTVAAPMAILLPQLAALGVLVAVFKKCTIEVIRDDGSETGEKKDEE